MKSNVLKSPDNLDKPGCYGSIICASDESDICRRCPYRTECFNVSDSLILHIRRHLKIDEYVHQRNISRVKRNTKPLTLDTVVDKRCFRDLTDREKAELDEADLSEKNKLLVRQLLQNAFDGEYILKSLQNGNNPFGKRHSQVCRFGCDALLKGSVTFSSLTTEYRQRTKMSYKTANSAAHQFISVMIYLAVIVKSERLDYSIISH